MPRPHGLLWLALFIGTAAAVNDDTCLVNSTVTTSEKYDAVMKSLAIDKDVQFTVAEENEVRYFNSYDVNRIGSQHTDLKMHDLPDKYTKNFYFTKFPWNGTNTIIHFVDLQDTTWTWTNKQDNWAAYERKFPPGIHFDWYKAFLEYDGKDFIAIHQDGKAFKVTEDHNPIEEIADYKPKCIPRNGEHCIYDPYTGKTESRDKGIINTYCNFYVAIRDNYFFMGDGTEEFCVKKVNDPKLDKKLYYMFIDPYNKTSCTEFLSSAEPPAPSPGPSNPDDEPPKKNDTAVSAAFNSNLLASFVLCAVVGVFLKTMVV